MARDRVPGSANGVAVDGFEPATSIDEVIDRLAAIVSDARDRGDRLGYFPGLYLRTTLRVRDGIHGGRFVDGSRMERLDVVFANRYLEAYARHEAGEPPTDAWQYAFERAAEPEHLVLQHLMLGMNAHINLDLGIAASATCPGEAIGDLEHDFFEINVVLAEMVDVVQEDLNEISPLLSWVDRLGGRVDERLAHMFLVRSRSAAWRRARRLATSEGSEHPRIIGMFDRGTARLAQRICPRPEAQPRWLRRARRHEIDDPERVYDLLDIATR